MITIGSAAKLTGVHIESIRYYERVGLIGHPSRSAAGRRQYGAAEIRRLRLIKQCRELGLEMPAIRRMLELLRNPDAPCADVTHLVEEQIASVAERIRKLSTLRQQLSAMRSGCSNKRIADCHIIESIVPSLPANLEPSSKPSTW